MRLPRSSPGWIRHRRSTKTEALHRNWSRLCDRPSASLVEATDSYKKWLKYIIFMIFHDISWYFMIFHDISWYFMIFHDISWYFMIFQDISRYFMIFHDISWYFMIFHDISRYFTIFHDISWYFMIFHDISWYFSLKMGDHQIGFGPKNS